MHCSDGRLRRYDSNTRTGDTRDGLLAGEIGDMDEGVVEGCVDVGDTEDKLALSDLGTERDGLFLRGLDLLGGLHPKFHQSIHPVLQQFLGQLQSLAPRQHLRVLTMMFARRVC